MKKPIRLTLLSVSALLGLAACNPTESSSTSTPSSEDSGIVKPATSEEPVAEVTVSIVAPSISTITVGDTLQLEAHVENAKASDTLTWNSSNTAILSVDNMGKVTALTKGEAQVTASIAGKTSDPITITVEAKIDSTAYPRFLKLLTDAEAKDPSKVSALTLSEQNDEYHYQQNKDTKEWENVINRSYGTKWNASFYSDSKTSIETIETDKGEADKKTLHQYGIAHNRLVDVVSDYSNDQYSVNDQKSSSKEITNQEETNAFLNKGEFSKKIGALRYVLDNYFDGTKRFSSIEARRNASLEEKDGAYTLNTSEIVKDDVENNVYMEYTMTIKLDTAGYLSSLSAHVKSYDSETDGSKRRLTFDVTLGLEETIGTREADSSLNLDQYFFTNKNELNIVLTSGPYDNEPASDLKLNQKYFVRPIKISGSASTNIDAPQLVSITRDGKTASEDSYTMDENAITFKKGGEYVLTYKTALLSDFKVEATFVTHEVTSLEFSPKPSSGTLYARDHTYLANNVLAGDTSFALKANEGADDDTTVELVTNEAGATIEKDPSTPFGYILHTTKAGKVSLKGKSASGIETEVKEVNVFAYTDEGIAAYLASGKWTAVNTSYSYQDMEFTLNEGSTTSGKFTIVTSSESEILGNFEVKNKAVSFTNEKGGSVKAGMTITAGENGFYLGMNSTGGLRWLMLQ